MHSSLEGKRVVIMFGESLCKHNNIHTINVVLALRVSTPPERLLLQTRQLLSRKTSLNKVIPLHQERC